VTAADATVAQARGWQARLSLVFRRDGAVTRLARRSAQGPLQVQRPFYPGGGACHVYLLHPPGGIVGGDRLDIAIDAGAGTEVLLTTPAAGKFYRSAGPVAEQRQSLRVRPRARLEWLPQEAIVFSGAIARSTTRIDLDDGARVVAWEILCLGRPASGERFGSGRFEQSMELYRQGRPLLLERNRYDSAGPVPDASWGLGGHPVTALLVASDGDAQLLDAVRATLPDDGSAVTGVTCVDGVLVVRYLGDCTERARQCLIRAWQVLRQASDDGSPREFGVRVTTPDSSGELTNTGVVTLTPNYGECPRIWNT
jgi:urease accessory protein